MGKAGLYSLKRKGRDSHGCHCADVAHSKQQLCLHLVAVRLPCGHWKQGPAMMHGVPMWELHLWGSQPSKGVIYQNRMPSFKADSHGAWEWKPRTSAFDSLGSQVLEVSFMGSVCCLWVSRRADVRQEGWKQTGCLSFGFLRRSLRLECISLPVSWISFLLTVPVCM